MHGHGKLKIHEESSTYEGEFLRGQRHGQGKFSKNNYSYIGGYKNTLKSGIGTEKFSNGDKYTGLFKNDFFDGEGKMFY